MSLQKEKIMKGYILRWNPKISSWTEDRHENLMEELEYRECAEMNWSIYDWENLEEGDFFILQQVGTDSDGIAMIGTFSSTPYGDESWKRKDGTNLFYANMDVDLMISRRLRAKKEQDIKVLNEENKDKYILPAEMLEQKFPNILWHKGHSGVLIPQETLEPLVLELCLNMLQLQKPTENIAFHDRNTLWEKCCHYINEFCPEMRKRIIRERRESMIYEIYSKGESVDESVMDITSDKEKMKNGSPKTIDDIVEYLVPRA